MISCMLKASRCVINIFAVLRCYSPVSFTQEQILTIRQSPLSNFSPSFTDPQAEEMCRCDHQETAAGTVGTNTTYKPAECSDYLDFWESIALCLTEIGLSKHKCCA